MPELSPEINNFFQGAWPLLLMAVIFYFILWRPQKKEQKKRGDFLSSLKKGNKVVTIGGMHGEIVGLTDKIVTLRIAEKVEVEMARSAMSHLQSSAVAEEKK